jgi:hypothetical protein
VITCGCAHTADRHAAEDMQRFSMTTYTTIYLTRSCLSHSVHTQTHTTLLASQLACRAPSLHVPLPLRVCGAIHN